MRGGRSPFSRIVRAVVMFAVLYGFWLLLSGHYTAWLVISGAVICALVSLWALKLGLADEEGLPIQLAWNAVFYWPWLVFQIIKSAIDVGWRIVHPAMPITPALRRLKASQKTPAGITTYANSITLTPGTISVVVDWRTQEIIVHGLTVDGLDALAEGEMDRRVSAFEGTK